MSIAQHWCALLRNKLGKRAAVTKSPARNIRAGLLALDGAWLLGHVYSLVSLAGPAGTLSHWVRTGRPVASVSIASTRGLR